MCGEGFTLGQWGVGDESVSPAGDVKPGKCGCGVVYGEVDVLVCSGGDCDKRQSIWEEKS